MFPSQGSSTPSPGGRSQNKELGCRKTVEVLGACDPEVHARSLTRRCSKQCAHMCYCTYPVQKQALPQQNIFGIMPTCEHAPTLRVPCCDCGTPLCRSLHEIFHENDFVYVHTPIITSQRRRRRWRVLSWHMAPVPPQLSRSRVL